MTKIDNFKSFVRKNPNLIAYVREKILHGRSYMNYMIYMVKILQFGINI